MIIEAAPADETKFIRMRDVLDSVPVSRPTIYRMMSRNEFPRAIRIGSTSFWVKAEVDEWMQRKIETRER